MKLNSLTVLGIAVATLAMVALNAAAQERFRNFDLASNTPASYINTAQNSTNYTCTNALSGITNVIVGGPSFALSDYQYPTFVGVEQVMLLQTNGATAATTLGTNGWTVDTLDLSPDNVTWFSNLLKFTNNLAGSTLGGPVTSATYQVYYLLPTTGTNIFTAWRYARWGIHSEQNTNSLSQIQKFNLLIYR